MIARAGFFGFPFALILWASLFAGCLDGPAPAGSEGQSERDASEPGRWSPHAWKARLSSTNFSQVISTIHYLAATDGARLSLHLPAPLPSGTQIPTLLQLTPYQSLARRSLPPGTSGPAPDWRFFVERGAAYVEADARGSNASEGCLDFGGSADRSDARVFAQWIRSQPWSNGVVVTDGISHPGMGSVVAHAAIPDLAAALAHAPVVSYYQDEWLQGAKFEDQLNGPGYQAIELLPAVYASPEALRAQAATCTGRTALDYSVYEGPFTEKWADRDLSRHVEDAGAPILLTHGFIDNNVHPDHSQLYWDALPDDFPKSMVLGWWYHGWPDLRGHPAETFRELRHRWLDATLFGRDNGLWQEPRVLVEDNRGAWHEGNEWPLEPSQSVTLYPQADGGLETEAGTPATKSYVDAVGSYRGRWAGASVVFRTEPLTEERLVNGAPVLHLVASSSAPATKWVAYLLREKPDGTWERVSHGYADSHSHGQESQWLAMQPGQVYDWDLRLLPTAVVLEKGDRLVLLIASQDSRRGNPTSPFCFPDYRGGCYNPSGILPADSVGRATNTVRLGPNATAVTVHWADPAATQKVPWPAK